MKIGLMGCEFFSPNKGCEALTYSIMYILDKLRGNDNLTVYNFSGTELGFIQQEFKNIRFENVAPKLKDPKFGYIKKIHTCDFILDATMGDSFSDIYSEKYFKNLMLHKKIAELFTEKYILLPQTYGPFLNKNSKKVAKNILLRATKIYCRDELSKKILENEFKINNSELVTDMAFFLPYYKEKYSFNSKKIKLGINISGLLYRGGFESQNQFDLKMDYKEYIDKIIGTFSQDNNYEIHIIPHVIDLAENAHDDDYRVCQLIKEKYDNCVLAPAFDTSIDAKSYISNMDIFIGSRMHSTIAAFSSGVVTIPVSYSRKFEGLFNSLKYNYVINGKKETTDSAYQKAIKYISNVNELIEKQSMSMNMIETRKLQFISSLKEQLINKQ